MIASNAINASPLTCSRSVIGVNRDMNFSIREVVVCSSIVRDIRTGLCRNAFVIGYDINLILTLQWQLCGINLPHNMSAGLDKFSEHSVYFDSQHI